MDFETLSFDAPVLPTPFDRVPAAGPAALTDDELLTIVMAGARRRAPRDAGQMAKTPLDRTRVAKRLLRAAGTLRQLAQWSLPEIAGVAGIGERRAVPLFAAIELGRRTSMERKERGASLNGAAEVYRHYRRLLRDERKEVFVAALLDVKNRLLRDVRISEGTLNASLVHPREAFAPAIREPAHAVLFVHNHPSGDPTPSDEDQALTRRLVAAGDLLGIRVLDHLVLGEDDWYSFAESGRLR